MYANIENCCKKYELPASYHKWIDAVSIYCNNLRIVSIIINSEGVPNEWARGYGFWADTGHVKFYYNGILRSQRRDMLPFVFESPYEIDINGPILLHF